MCRSLHKTSMLSMHVQWGSTLVLSQTLPMNRARRPPLQHPLEPVFDRAVDSFSLALSPETIRHYRGTARNFLRFLGLAYPQVNRLEQLRREPHVRDWMSHLRSKV